MRIMVILDHYRPGWKFGGPIRSVENLCKILPDSLEMVVVARNKDFKCNEAYDIPTNRLIVTSNEKRYYLADTSLSSLKKAINIISPDIVYLNSFFSSLSVKYLFYTKLRLIDPLPIVLAPRGELVQAGLSSKQIKKKLFLSLNGVCNIYSNVTLLNFSSSREVNILSSINKKKYVITSEPPFFNSTQITHPKKEKGTLKLLFSGRIHPVKNLRFSLEVIKTVVDTVDNIVISLDICGPIEDEQYWKECKLIIDSLVLNDSIKIKIQSELKSDAYLALLPEYHALLLPTQTENYGHSIVECMLFGVIPVISNNTPWNDLIPFKNGWSISLAQKDKYVSALKYLLDLDQKGFYSMKSAVLEYSKVKFDKQLIAREYTNMFKAAIAQFTKKLTP